MNTQLKLLKEVTVGTEFENNLWLTGGAVRNELLGLPVHDYDLVTELDVDKLKTPLQQLPEYSNVDFAEYKNFGVLLIKSDSVSIEVTRARKENYRSNSRSPIEIEPATLKEDVFRRDFTINTLLKNLHTDELLDLTNQGLAHLESKELHTPGDPNIMFQDDPLRILRAFRFQYAYDFRFSDAVSKAIKKNAHRLSIVSIERITTEFHQLVILATKNGYLSYALNRLFHYKIFDTWLPELVTLKNYAHDSNTSVLNHSFKIAKAGADVCSNTLVGFYAGLLHDIAKPQCLQVNGCTGYTIYHPNHAELGAELATKILQRLKVSSSIIQAVAFMIKHHELDSKVEADCRPFYREILIKTKPARRAALDTQVRELLLLIYWDDIYSNISKSEAKAWYYLNLACFESVYFSFKNLDFKLPITGETICTQLQITSHPFIKVILDDFHSQIISGKLKLKNPDYMFKYWLLSKYYFHAEVIKLRELSNKK